MIIFFISNIIYTKQRVFITNKPIEQADLASWPVSALTHCTQNYSSVVNALKDKPPSNTTLKSDVTGQPIVCQRKRIEAMGIPAAAVVWSGSVPALPRYFPLSQMRTGTTVKNVKPMSTNGFLKLASLHTLMPSPRGTTQTRCHAIILNKN